MKKTKKLIICILVSIVVVLIGALFSPTWTASIEGENSISVLEQVEVNGSNHEVLIRGNNTDNPVILFVHGGPGSSEIPYASQYQDLLEQDFTVVQYDQRASGKSYHFTEDYSNLSTDLLVEDLLAMSDYISKRLNKEKIILIGHSAGTYIATQAAYQSPEKYEAYIGIGQMSDTIESELESLAFCIDQAEKEGNMEDVTYLQGLDEDIKNGDTVTPRNYVMKYGGTSRLIENPDGNSLNNFLSKEYNLLDVIRYNYGISYSQKMMLPDLLKKPLPNIVTKLELPVYFVMGKHDYHTTYSTAKKYLDTLNAEQKEFITFEKSAHYPQFEEKEKFYEWMSTTFTQ
ncbi:alpha/beta hydrolase [Psychrobacillus sp. AK 1817]|uniref:alpha/beta fold hydrolase n=1 Tax=Psychrobacillus sp. AK 1817 TaxID=2303505 RepID=UPI00119D8268|nr:alpha/beta hydrolase [Psychrobacillus sp. AK 1817]QEY22022.1 alpha/beta hydrolase [Psychrobacillus sp. AK 1817]